MDDDVDQVDDSDDEWDEFPGAYAFARKVRGIYELTIRCPICHNLHTHGGGEVGKPILYGHRVPHCLNPRGSRGYILYPAPTYMLRPDIRPDPKVVYKTFPDPPTERVRRER